MSEESIVGRHRTAPGQADGKPITVVAPKRDKKTVDKAIADATLTAPEDHSALVEYLIGQYAPPEGQLIRVVVGAKTLLFNPITDRAILNDIKRRAIAELNKPLSSRPEDVRDFFKTDADTMSRAFTLASLISSPALPLVEFLRFAKKAALLFETIFNQWSLGQAGEERATTKAVIDRAKERISRDPMWRNRLTVARDVYGRHPLELEGGTYEDIMLLDFVALQLIENEERKT